MEGVPFPGTRGRGTLRAGASLLACVAADARAASTPVPVTVTSPASATSAIRWAFTQPAGVVENARSNEGATTSTWIASMRPL